MRENGPIPSRRRSLHPYRDSAIVYGILAALVVLIAVLTGGRVAWSIVLGIAAFLLATGWTWWHLRQQAERRR
jgi:predicted tellurium resistance membrane protein TerC